MRQCDCDAVGVNELGRNKCIVNFSHNISKTRQALSQCFLEGENGKTQISTEKNTTDQAKKKTVYKIQCVHHYIETRWKTATSEFIRDNPQQHRLTHVQYSKLSTRKRNCQELFEFTDINRKIMDIPYTLLTTNYAYHYKIMITKFIAIYKFFIF